MKVKDLIQLLEKEDQNLKVVVQGYEGGYDFVKSLEKVKFTENKEKLKSPKDLWWIGDLEESDSELDETAILLPRGN